MENDHFVSARMARLDLDGAWTPDEGRGLAKLRRGIQSRRRRRVLLGAIVAAGFGSFAFPGTRVLAERCVDACVAQTGSVREWLGLGQTPDFALPDHNGRVVRLSDFRGKAVIVNFWAPWCPPCKDEMPWFAEFQRDFRDLVVVGVAMEDGGWSKVLPAMASLDVNYSVVLGTDQTASIFGGVDRLPATFLLDRSGRVAGVWTGKVRKSDYEGALRKILGERP